MTAFFFVLFVISFFIQGLVTTTLPLTIVALVIGASFWKKPWIFLFAFIGGILIDVLGLRTIGETSLFFVAFLGLVFLYQRKFEIQSAYFVVAATGIGSFLYLLFFGFSQILLQTSVAVFLAILLYAVIEKLLMKRKDPNLFPGM